VTLDHVYSFPQNALVVVQGSKVMTVDAAFAV
jgi:hypothetical protein